jgi:hypothetical protein
MLIRKYGAGIDRVHGLTVTAAMHRHMTAGGLPEVPGVLHTRTALRTVKAVRMKVLPQPRLAQLVIAYIQQWKAHICTVQPNTSAVNQLANSLGMSQNVILLLTQKTFSDILSK